MTTATMDDEVFREFRKIGLPEGIAAKMAGVVSRRDESIKAEIAALRATIEDCHEAVRSGRVADREAVHDGRKTDRECAQMVREADRAANREIFGSKSDVAMLRCKAEITDSAIKRIDGRFDRVEQRIERLREKSLFSSKASFGASSHRLVGGAKAMYGGSTPPDGPSLFKRQFAEVKKMVTGQGGADRWAVEMFFMNLAGMAMLVVATGIAIYAWFIL